jgi:hypothetical protein
MISFSTLGTSDCLCPPDEWDVALYKIAASSCKYVANIVDGGHCGFSWDGAGNIPCKLVVDGLGVWILLSYCFCFIALNVSYSKVVSSKLSFHSSSKCNKLYVT